MDVQMLHHVSLPVTDVERSKRFYREVLGLPEIERPPFEFEGAWFAIGEGQLHLIVHDGATMRGDRGVDSRDIHFAVRVESFGSARKHLESMGFSADAGDDEPLKMKVSEHPTAGFPQIYVLDPDHNVVEINAASLDA